jgi:hypothetical protein
MTSHPTPTTPTREPAPPAADAARAVAEEPPAETSDSRRPSRAVRVWILVAIWAGLSALLAHRLQSRDTPYVFVDEAFFGKLAQNVGNGEGFTYQGQPSSFRTLYPYLIAPAWLFFKGEAAYHAALAINAAAMSAALFPAYALARRVAPFAWAVLAGVLAAVSPSIVWSGMLMTESLAYPAAALALLAMVEALARPGPRSVLLLAGALLFAALVRGQLAVLAAAFPAAVAIDLLVNRRRFRERVTEHRWLLGAAAAGIAIALLLVAFGNRDFLLGSYDRVADETPPLGALAETSLSYVAVLGIAVAFVPLIAAIALMLEPRNWRDTQLGPLLAVLIPATAALLVSAAWVTETVSPELRERYVFYAMPGLAACAAALIRYGRWPLVAGVGVLSAFYMRPTWPNVMGRSEDWRDYDFDALRGLLLGPNHSYVEAVPLGLLEDVQRARALFVFAIVAALAYALRGRFRAKLGDRRWQIGLGALVLLVPLVWLKLGPLRYLEPHGLLIDMDNSQERVTFVAAAILAGTACLGTLLRRRTVGALLVLVPTIAFGYFWFTPRLIESNRLATSLASAYPQPADWVDREADGPVAFLRTKNAALATYWHYEVWNEDLEQVYRLDDVQAENGFGQDCVIVRGRGGRLEPPDSCGGIPFPSYLVVADSDRAVGLSGATLIFESEHLNSRLYRLEPRRPVRIVPPDA